MLDCQHVNSYMNVVNINIYLVNNNLFYSFNIIISMKVKFCTCKFIYTLGYKYQMLASFVSIQLNAS